MDLSSFDKAILTVAYPPFGAPRAHLAKYTGSQGVVVLASRSRAQRASVRAPEHSLWMLQALERLGDGNDGDILYHATCDVGTLILPNMLPCREAVEIESGGSYCSNPFYWPMMAMSRGASWYLSLRGVPPSYVKPRKINLAGYEDQNDCTRDIKRGASIVATEGKGRRLVLFGCSRGATTTCLAALKLSPDVAQHVGLVLLEAPFDNLESVVRESSWTPGIVMSLIKRFGKYDGDQGAYELPDMTHLRCPIAFVTSAVDTRVPESCTLRLMEAVRASFPHLQIHHLRLRHNNHDTMLIGHPEDRAAYVAFVETLYRQHITPVS
jgi:hypothetical protein